jgi:hypothetical protein
MRFALVIDGKCAGFVLRSRHQYQAWDGEERPLGIFETESGAVSAISQTLMAKST